MYSEVTEQVQRRNLNKYWKFMLISSYPPHKYESLYHTDPIICCKMEPNGTKHPILRQKQNTSSISTQQNQFSLHPVWCLRTTSVQKQTSVSSYLQEISFTRGPQKQTWPWTKEAVHTWYQRVCWVIPSPMNSFLLIPQIWYMNIFVWDALLLMLINY